MYFIITRHGDKKINLTRGGGKEADKILAIAIRNNSRRNATKKLLEGETRVSQNIEAFVSIRQITVKIMPRARSILAVIWALVCPRARECVVLNFSR